MVHLNWKLSKVHESFVKKYKFADANLHYLVCNGVALHGMFWESMVDLGSGLHSMVDLGFAAIFADWRRDRKWLLQERGGHHLSEPVTPSPLKINCFSSNVSKYCH